MKRIITFIIAIVILSSCLGLTVFAKSDTVTFSEDFLILYTDVGSYSPINANLLKDSGFMFCEKEAELSDKQKESVFEVLLDCNDSETMFSATICYRDGSKLTRTYLYDGYRDIYDKLIAGNVSTYTVDFFYPYGNEAKVNKDALFGEQIILDSKALHRCDFYYVYAESVTADIGIHTGVLLIDKDNYYYADFDEIGFDKANTVNFDLYKFDSMEVHKITDTDALKVVRSAEEDYYDDDLGFLYNSHFTETITLIFLFIVFVAVPLAIFIIALIFAIRNKGLYKKLYTTILLLSGSELVVAAIVFAIMYISGK